jgi:hypothetical protein
MSGPPLLSGGGFGLEASLLGLVPATILGLYILYLAMKRGEVRRPMWSRPKLDATAA